MQKEVVISDERCVIHGYGVFNDERILNNKLALVFAISLIREMLE